MGNRWPSAVNNLAPRVPQAVPRDRLGRVTTPRRHLTDARALATGDRWPWRHVHWPDRPLGGLRGWPSPAKGAGGDGSAQARHVKVEGPARRDAGGAHAHGSAPHRPVLFQPSGPPFASQRIKRLPPRPGVIRNRNGPGGGHGLEAGGPVMAFTRSDMGGYGEMKKVKRGASAHSVPDHLVGGALGWAVGWGG